MPTIWATFLGYNKNKKKVKYEKYEQAANIKCWLGCLTTILQTGGRKIILAKTRLGKLTQLIQPGHTH